MLKVNVHFLTRHLMLGWHPILCAVLTAGFQKLPPNTCKIVPLQQGCCIPQRLVLSSTERSQLHSTKHCSATNCFLEAKEELCRGTVPLSRPTRRSQLLLESLTKMFIQATNKLRRFLTTAPVLAINCLNTPQSQNYEFLSLKAHCFSQSDAAYLSSPLISAVSSMHPMSN